MCTISELSVSVEVEKRISIIERIGLEKKGIFLGNWEGRTLGSK